MAGFFKKVADRFRPSPIEQRQQSVEAKNKLREPAQVQAKPVKIDTETQRYLPTGGELIRPQIRIETTIPTQTTGYSQTEWEIKNYRKERVWQLWHTATNNMATITTYNDPWQQWHNCGTAATTDVWTTWHRADTTSNIISVTNAWANWADEADDRFTTRKMSKAERLRREEEERRWRAEEEVRQAQYRREHEENEAKRKAADDRAMGLLNSMLSPQQQHDLKTHKHFFVNAPSGRLYRIDQGTHGNLKVVHPTTRKVVERLCVQPDGVPAGDAMLMQKLLIETAENALRAHANITLDDGTVIRGDTAPLTGERLAQIIPLRRAA